MFDASFDQCVGARQERFRNLEAYGLRSLEIEGQLELRGLLYGHVFGLLALQNSLHKLGGMPNRRWPVCAERHQAADMGWPQSEWPEFRAQIDPKDFMVPQMVDPGDARWSTGKGNGNGMPALCRGKS